MGIKNVEERYITDIDATMIELIKEFVYQVLSIGKQ